jgi:hypothetical protein
VIPAAATLIAADPPPESIRGWVDEIVARPEFQPPPPTLLERVADAVERLLEWIARPLSSAGAGGIYGVVAWIVLVGAAVLLAWGLVRLVTRWAPGPRRRRADGVAAEEAGGGVVAAEWRRRAEAAEAAGDLDLAVRCWWRALVADLDDLGALDEHPAGTAGEYRAEVAARRLDLADLDLGEPFDRSTDVFEPVWYGGRPAGAAELRTARSAAERATRRR